MPFGIGGNRVCYRLDAKCISVGNPTRFCKTDAMWLLAKSRGNSVDRSTVRNTNEG